LDIILQVSLNREEGKDMSRLRVEEELIRSVEGESLDVDDSVYTAESAEVIEPPKDMKKREREELGLGDALDALGTLWAEKHPIMLDAESDDEWDAMDCLIFSLVNKGRLMKVNKGKSFAIVQKARDQAGVRKDNIARARREKEGSV
jgi:hypothetical protein